MEDSRNIFPWIGAVLFRQIFMEKIWFESRQIIFPVPYHQIWRNTFQCRLVWTCQVRICLPVGRGKNLLDGRLLVITINFSCTGFSIRVGWEDIGSICIEARLMWEINTTCSVAIGSIYHNEDSSGHVGPNKLPQSSIYPAKNMGGVATRCYQVESVGNRWCLHCPRSVSLIDWMNYCFMALRILWFIDSVPFFDSSIRCFIEKVLRGRFHVIGSLVS